MPSLLWPIHALPAQDIAVNPAFRNVRGGAAIAYGESQIIASDAGMWAATLGNVLIRDSNSRKAWRAIQSLLEGSMTPILIPLCRADQPVPAGAVAAGLYAQVPHSDDAFFDDDSGYIGRVIWVSLASNAALRATTIYVTVHYAAELEPGHFFSIGERLYRIKSIPSQTATSATLKIWPPLREAATAGDPLEFDNPTGLFRLAGDNEMDLELAMRRSARPTVRFVEAL